MMKDVVHSPMREHGYHCSRGPESNNQVNLVQRSAIVPESSLEENDHHHRITHQSNHTGFGKQFQIKVVGFKQSPGGYGDETSKHGTEIAETHSHPRS